MMNKQSPITVSICSRRAAEMLLREGFPPSTAVISFHDPEKAPVDYSPATDRVRYVPLDDFAPALPEAGPLAGFIHSAIKEGLNILCQCELGQSRSAGCAAAILQHFWGKGDDILDSDSYVPDMMVYYELLDALEAVAAEEKTR